jgi:glycosyltransferase involved in cell wall biosynthesis
MKPVLFVTHDLARAGAQNLLVRFLEWLKRAGEAFELLLLLPRSASPESPALSLLPRAEAQCRVWMLEAERAENLAAIQEGAYRLIFLSTCGAAVALEGFDPGPTPVLCHAHELTYWLAVEFGQNRFPLLRRVDRFVAGAECVRSALTSLVGIEGARISVVPECISVDAVRKAAVRVSRASARDALKVGHGQFLVAMCGTLAWVKGVETIVPLMASMRRAGLDFVFLWISHRLNNIEHRRLAYAAGQAGLYPRLRVVGTERMPAELLAAADVFALTSLEDTFPLVMLEAAASGLPLVAFANAGGADDFITEEMGVRVPYGDPAAMAEAIVGLASDPGRRRRMGDAARTGVEQFDESRVFPRLAAFLR